MTSYNMKKIYTFEIIFFLVLLSIILAMYSCSKDEGESAVTKTERLLTSTWQLEKLTVDGVDQTTLFPALVITLSKGSYTAQNGAPVWPASGTWNLTDENTISRDNNTEIIIVSLSETNVTLRLHWNKDTFGKGGRATSVVGNHSFEFRRK